MHSLVYIFVIIAFIIVLKLKLKSPIELFDDVIVLDACKNMTPAMLLKKFDNDADKLVTTLIDNGVPSVLIEDKNAYPIIASYLVSKGVVNLEC